MTAGAAYWEVALPAGAEAAEVLANFLWEQGALGVVEEESAGDRAVLRAFFAPDRDAMDLAGRLDRYTASLAALGLAAGPLSVRPLTDPGWHEAWRRHFRPLPVGRRLLVVPPWEPAAADGRLPLVIEPGRAFGTGHHASTAGCLVRLEAVLQRWTPDRMLDLGAGSGILAIAAARLGVSRVIAVDEDPDAVAAIQANAARNAVGDRVVARQGDVATLPLAAAPLVAANLLGAAHRRLAAVYRRVVEPGGRLILGGLLAGEAAGVAGALAVEGFSPAASVSREGWVTLDLARARTGDPGPR
ncbi:MAG TPA: 50S ribosomal protein L11 methyltransferase [Candidatus Binatia bacterium]|nr:50S ribosomal protein L11 methyltransferase [Candidatus Binatia bacterium]